MNRKPMAIVCLAIILIKKYMDGRHHFQIKLNMPFNYLMQKSLFSIDIKNISQEKMFATHVTEIRLKLLI